MTYRNVYRPKSSAAQGCNLGTNRTSDLGKDQSERLKPFRGGGTVVPTSIISTNCD